MIARQLPGRRREHGLPTMPGREQPRDAVEGGAEVIAIAHVGHTGVDRHANPQRADRTPLLSLEPALSRQGSGKRIGGGDKGGADGIADGFEDLAAVRCDLLPEKGVVASERREHGLRVLLPELCTAFDVSEQERERPAWKG